MTISADGKPCVKGGKNHSSPTEDHFRDTEEYSLPTEDCLCDTEEYSSPTEDYMYDTEDRSSPTEDCLRDTEDHSSSTEDRVSILFALRSALGVVFMVANGFSGILKKNLVCTQSKN